MAVIDCNDPATLAEIWPSRVLDATGAEIEWVVWCDTDTGRVCREVWDGGSPVVNVGEIQRVWENYPAPLRLVKIVPGEMETIGR